MSQRDESKKLKRESSILSYFARAEPAKSKSTTGFVSAKEIKTQQLNTTFTAMEPSCTPLIKTSPFVTSKSAKTNIINDSKYNNAELYGDQKLVFSAQLTAKRRTTAPSPAPAPKLTYSNHRREETVLDLTVSNSSFDTNERSFSQTEYTASLSQQSYTPNRVSGPPRPVSYPCADAPNNVKSTNLTKHINVNLNQYPSSTGFVAKQFQPTASSTASSTSGSMFSSPSFSSASRTKAKRDWPFNTFSDAKKQRPSPSSSQEPYTLTPIGNYTLSPEQNAVLRMALFEGKSLFFTGSAGTGKSILLREIIAQMKRRHGTGIAVTASTGIAACNIGGLTLHSFAGIGLGHDSTDKLVKKIKGIKVLYKRWEGTTVLIIDEGKFNGNSGMIWSVSMIDGDLFDKLEIIARAVRGTSKPFGGIQLILTGDFFQLPPVGKEKVAKYCFDSSSWERVVEKNVMLTHVFRQKDQEFASMLNEMRLNQMSSRTMDKFKSLARTPSYADSSIEPTRLYSLRNQVDAANVSRLQHLKGNTHRYSATDWGDKHKLNGCTAPLDLELKKDAQVMLLKNMTPSLVNGSTGIVVGFTNEGEFKSEQKIRERILEKERPNGQMGRKEEPIIPTEIYPIVRFVNGQEIVVSPERWEVENPGGELVATRTQIPLTLAWALSIHKSQGQTLDRVFVDLGSVFEKGQAYVALSRATDINSLQVLNFNPAKVVADQRVVEFYRQLSCV